MVLKSLFRNEDMSNSFIDILKTSRKYAESRKRLGRKLVKGYEELDIFLNDICYESDPYIEEGGSDLTYEDYQCKGTFDKAQNNKD